MNGEHPPMQRVSKRNLCLICGRPDWCLVAEDASAAICARISEGGVKQCGAAGWLHILSDRPKDPTQRRTRTVRLRDEDLETDFGALAESYAASATRPMVAGLADQLGLSIESLCRLRVGWSAEHGAWTFPMHGADDCVRGIRLRKPDGGKFSVRGGREGVFYPHGLTFAEPLLLPEGPSDVAVLLGLRFEAVGRPNCTGGSRLLVEMLRRKRPPAVIVVSDNDAPGLRGAERLARSLTPYCPEVRMIRPPEGISDARAWVQARATREDVLRVIEAAPVRGLTVRRSGT